MAHSNRIRIWQVIKNHYTLVVESGTNIISQHHHPNIISGHCDGDDDKSDAGGCAVIAGVVWIKWPPLARRDLHFSHHTPSFESFEAIFTLGSAKIEFWRHPKNFANKLDQIGLARSAT